MHLSSLFRLCHCIAVVMLVQIARSEPIVAVPATAQIRTTSPQILVEPDHPDWTYKLGESVSFTVRIVCDHAPVSGVQIQYRVGPERFEGESATAVVPEEGLRIDGGTMKVPGFLRCRASSEIQGNHYEAMATAAFEPENITPTQVDPPDFDAYWAGYVAKLSRVPMRLKKELNQDASTPEVNVYNVSFDSWGERNVLPGFLV